jgi:hypothetical protein
MQLAQSCLVFDKRFAAHVVAIEHQQIKSDCDCIAIIATTMEQIELRRGFRLSALVGAASAMMRGYRRLQSAPLIV